MAFQHVGVKLGVGHLGVPVWLWEMSALKQADPHWLALALSRPRPEQEPRQKTQQGHEQDKRPQGAGQQSGV